ncbi:MAG TPA: UDP-3-O-acyl-N-acetylglucosamine deacetylase [Pyrinomonadaceae bacterium]|nr:UDP-3-O-acyl-N-acetylglucosamine deacetylase [Pyrinomonadaceae bacterium]
MKQTTLATSIELKGKGLHTGVETNIRLSPAPDNTSYVFIRTDLDDYEIPALVEFVSHCSYATTLMRGGVVISTCEHLLSALYGLGIDNCFIEIDNIEIPILDGSAEDWIEAINKAGRKELTEPRRYLRVRKKIELSEGNRQISLSPSDRFEISCTIDFPHPMIGRQSLDFALENGNYQGHIASARTFGFLKEIEVLQKANLALGGSLDNAIVLTEDGMLNENPLRWADEFVRHKILDIIGDAALLGLPLLGRIKAERSGHAVHAAIFSKLLRSEDAWEIIESN